MLKRLYDWRIGCTAQQLLDFEAALAPVSQSTIRQQTLDKHYNGRYHCALMNKSVLLAAIQTQQHGAAGEQLARELAKHNGIMASEELKREYNAAFLVLKARGIVFEHHDHYCLPAEFILMLKHDLYKEAWFSLCSKFPKILLQQIIPNDIGFITAKGAPSQNEMAAWLACEGLKDRGSLRQILDDKDWELLHHLDMHGGIHSFNIMSKFCADAITSMKIPGQTESVSALQGALERHFPERLEKLCHMGLIGLLSSKGRNMSINIVMSEEGGYRLLPYRDEVRTYIADKEKESWAASKCKIGTASPWRNDHDLWRLWMALHFMPLRKTRYGDLRKLDVKKILALLQLDDAELINTYACALAHTGFLTESPTEFTPAPIDWASWLKRQRKLLLPPSHKKASQQKLITRLISELPVDTWLETDKVVTWLKIKAGHALGGVVWNNLFDQRQAVILHHINKSGRYIYLPPLYHTVIKNELPSLPSPGWKGAEASASTSGFISAAGDIQLPAEFSHQKLQELSAICTLTAVGHMIELRLNRKMLAQAGTDKKQLTANSQLLESIQSPLPQPVSYLFDKQLNQQPLARIEAASLLIRLQKPAKIASFYQLGFSVRQPFPDLPDIILLEDGANANAFILACQDAGLPLEIGVSPKCWIEGFSSIFEWVKEPEQREGQWLEVCYQKQRNSKPKQIIARIQRNFSDSAYNFFGLEIRAVRKTKQGYVVQKDPMYLESKHIIRLRTLHAIEMTALGLDKLS